MSEVTFCSEPFGRILEEIKPLLSLHWSENANHQDKVPLDPNWAAYEHLESIGVMEAIAARDEDNRLVGYYISSVLPHPHYRSTLYSFNDVYFLLPEYRTAANGIKLFVCYEESMLARMKRDGYDKIVLIGRARFPHDPGKILKRLGWELAETVWTKLLETEI